jgi:sulfur carrier protein ThiS
LKLNINKAVDEISAQEHIKDMLANYDLNGKRFAALVSVGEDTVVEIAGLASSLEIVGLGTLIQDMLFELAETWDIRKSEEK